MRRLLLVILLVAILPRPGSAASTAVVLPYNLVLSPRPTSAASTGTVTGQFGGVPVGGTYKGNASSGTFTLTVKGMDFVEGAYACSNPGCAFTGTVAGKRVVGGSMSSLSGTGQATAGVFPNREAWLSAVSDWANAHLGNDQAASIVAATAGVNTPQTLNEHVREDGHGEGGGEHGGMGDGHGGMNH